MQRLTLSDAMSRLLMRRCSMQLGQSTRIINWRQIRISFAYCSILYTSDPLTRLIRQRVFLVSIVLVVTLTQVSRSDELQCLGFLRKWK